MKVQNYVIFFRLWMSSKNLEDLDYGYLLNTRVIRALSE
jgi:hypothetical protein